MKLKFLAAVGLAATLYSCDGETTGIGQQMQMKLLHRLKLLRPLPKP